MGISIIGKYNNNKRPPEALDMGYISFHQLRCTVARNLHPEFGEVYKNALIKGGAEADNELNEAIQRFGLDTDDKIPVLDFLFASDGDGEMDETAARSILKLVADEPDSDIYGYAGWKNPSTMGDFKKLLRRFRKCKGRIIWR